MQQRLFIRLATKADARRISYLIQKNAENVVENNYSAEQIATWKRANTPSAIKRQLEERTLFCAFRNGKLAGTIGLQDNEVLGLYVSYSQRKQGIGRQLLYHVEAYAREQKIEALTLNATPSGLPFYQSHGFEVLEQVDVDIMGTIYMETNMWKVLE